MFRRTARAILGLLVACLVVPGAQATTAVERTEDNLIQDSTLIVAGHCTHLQSQWAGRTLVTLATIQVSEVLKGGAATTVTVTLPGGVDANRRIPVAMGYAGAPEILQQENVVLFSRRRTWSPAAMASWATRRASSRSCRTPGQAGRHPESQRAEPSAGVRLGAPRHDEDDPARRASAENPGGERGPETPMIGSRKRKSNAMREKLVRISRPPLSRPPSAPPRFSPGAFWRRTTSPAACRRRTRDRSMPGSYGSSTIPAVSPYRSRSTAPRTRSPIRWGPVRSSPWRRPRRRSRNRSIPGTGSRRPISRRRSLGTVANTGPVGDDMINEITFNSPTDDGLIAVTSWTTLMEDTTLRDGDDLNHDGIPDVSSHISTCIVGSDGRTKFPAGFYKAGTILDIDVEFKTSQYRFTVNDADVDTNTRSVDLQADATHEFGHTIGLSHVLDNQRSPVDGNGSTMFPVRRHGRSGLRALPSATSTATPSPGPPISIPKARRRAVRRRSSPVTSRSISSTA